MHSDIPKFQNKENGIFRSLDRAMDGTIMPSFMRRIHSEKINTSTFPEIPISSIDFCQKSHKNINIVHLLQNDFRCKRSIQSRGFLARQKIGTKFKNIF